MTQMNDNIYRPLVSFFSQTGEEIVNLYKETGIKPVIVVTNKRPDNLRTIHPDILNEFNLIELPNKPSIEDYLNVLTWFENPIITLHGWLRVVPKEICDTYEIWNGHPGLITKDKYGDILKGFNPQEKAFRLGLNTSGCVIHRVTSEVDEGPILMWEEVGIRLLSLDEVYSILRKTSLSLWKTFFNTYIVKE